MDSTFLVDECNFCRGIPRNPVGEDLVADMVIGAWSDVGNDDAIFKFPGTAASFFAFEEFGEEFFGSPGRAESIIGIHGEGFDAFFILMAPGAYEDFPNLFIGSWDT